MFNFMSNMGSTITIIVATPFVLLVLWLIYRAIKGRRQVAASMSWGETTGRVLFATVEARRSRSGSSGYSTSYYPNVVYEYQVDGQRFQSNRLAFGDAYGLGSHKRVQRRVEQYPLGGTITVYYDPNDPSQSVLERAAPSTKIYWFVIIFILAILALTFAFQFGLSRFMTGFSIF